MSVVPFKKKNAVYREEDAITGPVRCRGCGHKWVGISPEGAVEFECPECGTLKGVRDSLITPEERYACKCGCDVFSFSKKNIYCANCGLYHEPWAENF
jgi:predicted RNA-binding Zn-ribbon protein involved in translation (DUF1610 family)